MVVEETHKHTDVLSIRESRRTPYGQLYRSSGLECSALRDRPRVLRIQLAHTRVYAFTVNRRHFAKRLSEHVFYVHAHFAIVCRSVSCFRSEQLRLRPRTGSVCALSKMQQSRGSQLPPPPPGIRSMVAEETHKDIDVLSRTHHLLSAQKFARLEVEARQSLPRSYETLAEGLIEPFKTTFDRIRQEDQEKQLIYEASDLPRPFGDATLRKQLAELDELVQPFRFEQAADTIQHHHQHRTARHTSTLSSPVHSEAHGSPRLRLVPDTSSLSSTQHHRLGQSGPGRLYSGAPPSRSPSLDQSRLHIEDVHGARLQALLEREEESMRMLRATLSSITGAALGRHREAEAGRHGRVEQDAAREEQGDAYSPSRGAGAMPPLPASPSTSAWGTWSGTHTGTGAGTGGGGSMHGNGLYSVLQPSTEPRSTGPAASLPSNAGQATTLVVSGPQSTVNRLYRVLQPVAGDAQALTRTLLQGQDFLLLLPPALNGAGHGTRELARPHGSFLGHSSVAALSSPVTTGGLARRRVRVAVQQDLRTLTWASAGQVVEGRLQITRLTSIRVPGHEEQAEHLEVSLRDAVQPETLVILTTAEGEGASGVVRLVGPDPYTTATWVAGLTFLHDILPCTPS